MSSKKDIDNLVKSMIEKEGEDYQVAYLNGKLVRKPEGYKYFSVPLGYKYISDNKPYIPLKDSDSKDEKLHQYIGVWVKE